MKINRAVSVVGAISSFIAVLSFPGGSLAAAGAANEPRIGEHFKVIPAADGTNEITLVANGLNYQDTNGNWIESIPIVQSFSSAIVCTGASYLARKIPWVFLPRIFVMWARSIRQRTFTPLATPLARSTATATDCPIRGSGKSLAV